MTYFFKYPFTIKGTCISCLGHTPILKRLCLSLIISIFFYILVNMDTGTIRLDLFSQSFKKCKCKDCYGYEKYIKEESKVNHSVVHTESRCQNDLFHQTPVLGETVCVSSDFGSNSSLTEMSDFNYLLETINPAQRSCSTGNIPTIGEGNGAFGKSKSACGFPANYSECMYKLTNH